MASRTRAGPGSHDGVQVIAAGRNLGSGISLGTRGAVADFDRHTILRRPHDRRRHADALGVARARVGNHSREQSARPGRVIPSATLLGTVITAFICGIACTTVLLLVPPATLAPSNAPFVDLAARFWGRRAGKVVAMFAAISGFGALNGWILLQGELPRDGEERRISADIRARIVPLRAGFGLLFSSTLVSLLILTNYQKSMVNVFTFMILLSTTACLVFYPLCSFAMLRLQWTGRCRRRAGRA